jgi:hypothetical protein
MGMEAYGPECKWCQAKSDEIADLRRLIMQMLLKSHDEFRPVVPKPKDSKTGEDDVRK